MMILRKICTVKLKDAEEDDNVDFLEIGDCNAKESVADHLAPY